MTRETRRSVETRMILRELPVRPLGPLKRRHRSTSTSKIGANGDNGVIAASAQDSNATSGLGKQQTHHQTSSPRASSLPAAGNTLSQRTSTSTAASTITVSSSIQPEPSPAFILGGVQRGRRPLLLNDSNWSTSTGTSTSTNTSNTSNVSASNSSDRVHVNPNMKSHADNCISQTSIPDIELGGNDTIDVHRIAGIPTPDLPHEDEIHDSDEGRDSHAEETEMKEELDEGSTGTDSVTTGVKHRKRTRVKFKLASASSAATATASRRIVSGTSSPTAAPTTGTGPRHRSPITSNPPSSAASPRPSSPATAGVRRLSVPGPVNDAGVEQRPITTQHRSRALLRLNRKHSPECSSVAGQHEPVLRSSLSQRPSSSSSSNTLADRHLLPGPTSKAPAMALKFLSGHSSHTGSSSSVKYFDIRLDNDYIVFRGNEDEAASSQLSGSVVLCLTEPLAVSHIDLTLSGILHMSWQTTSTSSMSGRRTASKEKTFFEKSWTFRDPGKGRSEILQPDNYEWPFQCILEGSLPESVEGMKEAWIIYRFKAQISRKRGRDIVVRKPLRIVRTLDSTALELAHAMSVENIWPNKIEYSISIPNKAVAFGSFVQVDFKLISLLKGLVIGNVSTQVKEEQEFVVDPEWGVSALSNGHTKTERVIASDLYRINPEVDEQIIDEVAEGYQFSRYLELPKSLNQCLQDCNVKGIKVRHKVKFNVQLHNPDGHISELRANLPVTFYISPSLPINENNDLVDQTPQASRAAVANDLANSAPPVYGKHTLDQLYSDVDGYRTPGTALSTPGTPYLHSRHASSENLASLAAITNGTYVSPIALQNRLQNLRVGNAFPTGEDELDPYRADPTERSRRNSSSAHVQDDYFAAQDAQNSGSHARASPNDVGGGYQSGFQSHTPSLPGSNLMSRRTSEEEDGHQSGARTPFPQYDHMEDLAKVPSYSTAVKTPAPRTDESRLLPTYGAVVSEQTTLTEPPTAHVRNSPRVPGSLASSPPDPSILSSNSRSASHRNVSALQDDERRLRVMQMRGR